MLCDGQLSNEEPQARSEVWRSGVAIGGVAVWQSMADGHAEDGDWDGARSLEGVSDREDGTAGPVSPLRAPGRAAWCCQSVWLRVASVSSSTCACTIRGRQEADRRARPARACQAQQQRPGATGSDQEPAQEPAGASQSPPPI